MTSPRKITDQADFVLKVAVRTVWSSRLYMIIDVDNVWSSRLYMIVDVDNV